MASRQTAAGIAPFIVLTSFCALSLEIILVRSFSIILWHHLIFMIISIALLGYGASGSLLALCPSLRKMAHQAWLQLLFLLPLTILGPAWFAYQLPFEPVSLFWNPLSILKLSAYYLILALPFANAGLIMSLGYTTFPEKASYLYLCDLLGGAAGALSGAFLFSATGGKGVPFVALIASLGPVILPGPSLRKKLVVTCPLVTLTAWAIMSTHYPIPQPNPYKEVPLAMRYESAFLVGTAYDKRSRVDIISSPAARRAPGLSLKYDGEILDTIGVAVDGGLLTPIPTDGYSGDDMLAYLPSHLPYLIGRPQNVLLEDSRGGLSLYQAMKSGVLRLVAAEPYPLAQALAGELIPEKTTWMEASGFESKPFWARNYLARSPLLFDLIDINLTTTVGPASMGLLPAREDYRLTVEAFGLYLDHLADGGILALTTYLLPPPRTEGKLMASAIETAEARYGPEKDGHFFVFRSFNTLTILVKSDPFTALELEKARLFCGDMSFDTVFYPGMAQEEANLHNIFPEPLYYRLFSSLLKKESREKLYRMSLFDYRPATDDRPFFFAFIKILRVREAAESLGGRLLPLLQTGLLIWLILLQAGLISAFVLILPLVALPGRVGRRWPLFAYFASLGLAYMLVEVSWMQRFTMATGDPTAAASSVIALFLFSSGLGSLSSSRLSGERSGRWAPLLAASAASLATVLFFTADWQRGFSMRIDHQAALILFGAPAAFCMGAPFPLGLRRLAGSDNGRLPWAWAANSCLSVIGAVAAPALARHVGYMTTALAGGMLYFLAFLTYPHLENRRYDA